MTSREEIVKRIQARKEKWDKAMNGDVQALIELGIEVLGQTDGKENEDERNDRV